MTLFDTHVHFDSLETRGGPASVIARAGEAGVERMIAVGANHAANAFALECAATFPAKVRAAVGYDRYEAAALNTVEELSRTLGTLRSEIGRDSAGTAVAAIGEIGLDLHYSPETRDCQLALFRDQLCLARELGLPVIVHSREADDLTIAELQSHATAWRGPPDGIGVLHCFTGAHGFAARLLDIGFYISFSGIVTFLNADPLRAVAASVPEDRLLIETDSPYLTPVPHRGKHNEPMYLPFVAQALARIRQCSVERLADLTTSNALRLFGIQHAGQGITPGRISC